MFKATWDGLIKERICWHIWMQFSHFLFRFSHINNLLLKSADGYSKMSAFLRTLKFPKTFFTVLLSPLVVTRPACNSLQSHWSIVKTKHQNIMKIIQSNLPSPLRKSNCSRQPWDRHSCKIQQTTQQISSSREESLGESSGILQSQSSNYSLIHSEGRIAHKSGADVVTHFIIRENQWYAMPKMSTRQKLTSTLKASWYLKSASSGRTWRLWWSLCMCDVCSARRI